MENTNTQTSNKKSVDCPCMDLNEKYAKGFNDDDLVIEDEEIDFDEMPSSSKNNKN